MPTVEVQNKHKKLIPRQFVHEIMDGRPLYYKGYKTAIKKNLTAESIPGISTYQAAIVSHILSILFKTVDLDQYWLFPGNPGIHLNVENEFVASVLICSEKEYPASRISTRYIDAPAELNLQVDIRAELEDFTEMDYIKRKTQKLLDFGTAKVIWIFTGTQTVLVAKPNEDRKWIDWNKSVELWQGTSFCIGEYLKNEGIIQNGL